MICLSFVLKNTLKLRISKAEEQAAAATKQLISAPSSVPGDPPVDSEKQREILEAQLEALHRDEWCRKFEEEEIKEHARQRMYKYAIQKREMLLEDAKDYLMELRARRMELHRRLFLEEQYMNAVQRNAIPPHVEVIDAAPAPRI